MRHDTTCNAATSLPLPGCHCSRSGNMIIRRQRLWSYDLTALYKCIIIIIIIIDTREFLPIALSCTQAQHTTDLC